METVFDHNPTKEELINLFGEDATLPPEQMTADSQMGNWARIAELYSLRGDHERVTCYLDKIEDLEYRLSTELGLYNLA